MNARVCSPLALLLLIAACSSPKVAATIEEEPICPDYAAAAGSARFQGSMRTPVTVTLLDGTTVVAQRMLGGLRGKGDPKSAIELPDRDAEYRVEWAQCAQRRPPRPVEAKEAPAWECGKVAGYRSEKLVTRKGDPASRRIVFALPPDAGCLLAEAPVEPPPRGGGPGMPAGDPVKSP